MGGGTKEEKKGDYRKIIFFYIPDRLGVGWKGGGSVFPNEIFMLLLPGTEGRQLNLKLKKKMLALIEHVALVLMRVVLSPRQHLPSTSEMVRVRYIAWYLRLSKNGNADRAKLFWGTPDPRRFLLKNFFKKHIDPSYSGWLGWGLIILAKMPVISWLEREDRIS